MCYIILQITGSFQSKEVTFWTHEKVIHIHELCPNFSVLRCPATYIFIKGWSKNCVRCFPNVPDDTGHLDPEPSPEQLNSNLTDRLLVSLFTDQALKFLLSWCKSGNLDNSSPLTLGCCRQRGEEVLDRKTILRREGCEIGRNCLCQFHNKQVTFKRSVSRLFY